MRTMPMTWGDISRYSDPCAACGRTLRHKAGKPRFYVHVINGGSDVLHPEDEGLYTPDAGDMAFHEVGPECRKKFPGFIHRQEG